MNNDISRRREPRYGYSRRLRSGITVAWCGSVNEAAAMMAADNDKPHVTARQVIDEDGIPVAVETKHRK